MTITKNGENLTIKFPFDYYLLRLVKSLNGRKYSPKYKHWTIPLIGSKQAVEKLAGEGFSVDSLVWEAIDADEQAARELELTAGQTDAEFATNLPLFNYQRVGAQFMVNAGSCLNAFEVGLGKTPTTLAAIEKLKVASVLIFCPSTLKEQWSAEILRFVGEKSVIIDGVQSERIDQWRTKAKYVIANYELLLRDLMMMPKEWDVIVCDESTRLSNPWTKTYRGLEKLTARYKFALTGTPVNNRPDSLYGIINWIKPGILGNYPSFIDRYCLKNIYGGIFGYRDLDELKNRVNRFMIRRTKQEVLPELPEKILIDVPFNPSKEEKEVYEKIRMELLHELKDELAKVENPLSIQGTITKMLRLQQAVNSLELLGRKTKSTKIEVLMELLKEITQSSDSKVLIYTKFSQYADLLEEKLAEYKPLKITGEVKKRQVLIDKFNNSGENRIMIVTDASAYGVNLQNKCAVVCLMDLPWSLGKMDQIIGRVHRFGQKDSVMVYRILGKGTIDMKVKKILEQKSRLAEAMLGDKPLTVDEVREILLD